jgi:hypothetical protein
MTELILNNLLSTAVEKPLKITTVSCTDNLSTSSGCKALADDIDVINDLLQKKTYGDLTALRAQINELDSKIALKATTAEQAEVKTMIEVMAQITGGGTTSVAELSEQVKELKKTLDTKMDLENLFQDNSTCTKLKEYLIQANMEKEALSAKMAGYQVAINDLADIPAPTATVVTPPPASDAAEDNTTTVLNDEEEEVVSAQTLVVSTETLVAEEISVTQENDLDLSTTDSVIEQPIVTTAAQEELVIYVPASEESAEDSSTAETVAMEEQPASTDAPVVEEILRTQQDDQELSDPAKSIAEQSAIDLSSGKQPAENISITVAAEVQEEQPVITEVQDAPVAEEISVTQQDDQELSDPAKSIAEQSAIDLSSGEQPAENISITAAVEAQEEQPVLTEAQDAPVAEESLETQEIDLDKTTTGSDSVTEQLIVPEELQDTSDKTAADIFTAETVAVVVVVEAEEQPVLTENATMVVEIPVTSENDSELLTETVSAQLLKSVDIEAIELKAASVGLGTSKVCEGYNEHYNKCVKSLNDYHAINNFCGGSYDQEPSIKADLLSAVDSALQNYNNAGCRDIYQDDMFLIS